MFFVKLVFILSVLFITYTYVLYPIILMIMSSGKNKIIKKNEEFLDQDVTFIISALNEESVIEERIRNIFSLDYDKSKINLILVNDCSEDNTLNVVTSALENEFFEYSSQIKLINNEQRRGKTGSLNRAVALAKTPFLFFTDANTVFKDDVLKVMMPNFADESVGAVRGQLKLMDEDASPDLSKGEKSFWSFDTKMAMMESCVTSAINLPGAIYILRKELYREIPENYIIMDDFFESISVIENSKRILLQENAFAFEKVSKDKMGEFKRRIRIATANFNSFKYMTTALNIKKHGVVSFFLISHKICRWFVFIPLILTILSIYMLSSISVFYAILFVLMMASFVLSMMIHANIKIHELLTKISKPFYFFYVMNIALLIGFFKSFKESKPYWNRVEREE